MITLNPYLVFKDCCEEAFNFYKNVFHADDLYVGYYKDVPQTSKQLFTISPNEKVMHATLQINSKTTLMGCDSYEAHEQPVTGVANNFYLYISMDSKEEAIRIFNELSVEGHIVLPISQTFWSDYYGMLIDKFGIQWKVTFN